MEDVRGCYATYNTHNITRSSHFVLPKIFKSTRSGNPSAQDPLNQQGDEAIDGRYFISRHEGMACKESPAWRFTSEQATGVMNGKIETFWKVCFHMERRWMEENLGGAFVP